MYDDMRIIFIYMLIKALLALLDNFSFPLMQHWGKGLTRRVHNDRMYIFRLHVHIGRKLRVCSKIILRGGKFSCKHLMSKWKLSSAFSIYIFCSNTIIIVCRGGNFDGRCELIKVFQTSRSNENFIEHLWRGFYWNGKTFVLNLPICSGF